MLDTKRIAIASPHYAPNYGTMLQAYALQETLYRMGCESEYINYNSRLPINHRINNALHLLFYHPKDFIKRICGYSVGENHNYFFTDSRFSASWKAFEDWHSQYIRSTQKTYDYTDIAQLEEDVSLFLVGSDQTWSPNLTKNYSTFYLNFLRFVKDEKKKNAYAPSFGTFQFTEKFKLSVLDALSSFSYLSCRESKGADWLEKSLKRHVEAVLDPTFLLRPKDWDKVSLPVSNILPERYVLCYKLGEKKIISEFAERVGKKLGLPVYYILTRPGSLAHPHCLSGIGPGQFISLIRGASCVCTDSFHGSAFCINYNIPFFSFTKREINDPLNDNERIKNLLQEFDLDKHYRQDGDMLIDLKSSFDHANEILCCRREKSLDYLSAILKSNNLI